MFSLFSFASGAIEKAIITFNGLIQQFLGQLLATVASWLGYFLKFQGNYFEHITIVEESWKIFRDFSNMFFILILIIIAFATIFDLKNYNWQGLMFKFIIAALLINFSLAIGGFLIQSSTTLSNVALNQFTDITENLAAGFGINNFITGIVSGSSADPSATLAFSSYLSSTGMIIMTVIILCAFVSAFAFAVARVPVLWALLIVSPVAWISYILPKTRRVWDLWWKWFFCWTFFMPAYLFSLVIGIAILNNRPDIASATRLSETSGALASAGNFIGFGVQDIFFYILTIIIMVGSLTLAMKMACAGGTGVAKTFGAISGGVNNFVKRATYFSALKKRAENKMGELQKKGLPGGWSRLYGGERAERLKEARVAEGIFGEKGAMQAEKDRTMREDIKTYKERFKATTDVKELKNNMETGPREQKLAIAELLKERGELGAKEMKGVFDLYREAGSDSNAIEFAKGIDYEKLSSEERKDLYNTLGNTNPETARKIAIAQAKKGDWRREEGEPLRNKLKQYASLFTTEGEKRDFINDVKKYNYEDATRVLVDMGLTKPKLDVDPNTGAEIPFASEEAKYAKAMADDTRGMNLDKLAELTPAALRQLMKEERTRNIIDRKITAENIGGFEGKLTDEQIEALKAPGEAANLIAKKKAEFMEKKKEEAEKAAKLTQEAYEKALEADRLKQQPSPPSTPRRPAGFVPPGSTVSGGVVKKLEENKDNVNPTNVLDLRKKDEG